MKLTCRDCIHYDVCGYHITEMTTMTIAECSHEFKNKADFAEVVRCKDCRIADEDIMIVGYFYCNNNRMAHHPDHFCSYGERRDTE